MTKRRGRPTKPTSLKILEGNPGRRELNTDEPMFASGAGAPPPWLSTLAADVWNELAAILGPAKILTAGDRHTFAVMCETYALIIEAARDFAANGIILTGAKGGACVNPAVYIFKTNAALFDKYASSFGMNPSARASLKVGGNESICELEKLLAT